MKNYIDRFRTIEELTKDFYENRKFGVKYYFGYKSSEPYIIYDIIDNFVIVCSDETETLIYVENNGLPVYGEYDVSEFKEMCLLLNGKTFDEKRLSEKFLNYNFNSPFGKMVLISLRENSLTYSVNFRCRFPVSYEYDLLIPGMKSIYITTEDLKDGVSYLKIETANYGTFEITV